MEDPVGKTLAGLTLILCVAIAITLLITQPANATFAWCIVAAGTIIGTATLMCLRKRDRPVAVQTC